MPSEKNIVHVLVDDKFIDGAIRKFETVNPDVHQYYMIGAAEPYRYVKDDRVLNLTLKGFESKVNDADVVSIIFHSLPRFHYGLLALVPEGKKVFWLGWGFDYYDFLKPAYPHGLVMPGTAGVNCPNLAKRIYRSAKSSIKNTIRGIGLNHNDNESLALARVDYFSPVLDSEYSLVCKYNSWFQAKYIDWNYGTVEDDFLLPGAKMNCLGDNFLVGNSATITNNHYEVFQSIKNQLDLGHRKVIVPLSYGDQQYRDNVVRCGEEILGSSFSPLLDFLPAEDYIQILKSCGFVMMNHIRQQALGSICISALMGAKLFLNPSSPLYSWLQEKGLDVGDVRCLDDKPLQHIDQLRNADAIKAHWSRDVQYERTRRLTEIALS